MLLTVDNMRYKKRGVVIYYIQINVCDKNAKNLKILNCLGDIAHSTE